MQHSLVFTNVSGQPMGLIFKGQGVIILRMLDICPKTSVINYKHTLLNFPEERSSRLHRRGRTQSRMNIAFMKYIPFLDLALSRVVSKKNQCNCTSFNTRRWTKSMK